MHSGLNLKADFGHKGSIGGEYFEEAAEECEGVFGLFNPELEFPGAGEDIIIREGKTFDRNEFEEMKDDYYTLNDGTEKPGYKKRNN